ncbi:MAG: DNA replication/repair protein RecF [Oscillospiraceae bacterium]|nr:DNA replication/repair protein RecF [Oscillospiraceae bacterium]
MHCTEITYTNFRNIATAQLTLSPGLNLLYGKNAQGKTNALEGIYLCAGGRSHRSSREREFIRHGEERGSVEVKYTDTHRTNTLKLSWTRDGRRECSKNAVPLPKMSEFIGNLRAVFFYPEHLSIIRDGPSERRQFLDIAISQIDRIYMANLREYYAALAQRNRLFGEYFTNRPAFDATIDIWSEKLAELAAQVAVRRVEYVEKLSTSLVEIFADMTGEREKPAVEYRCGATKEEYFRQLTANLEREARAGASLYGIHREDVEISLNEFSARRFGSQGQQRSLAIALKFAEGEISHQATGERPVYLLDDVLSELDSGRREYILRHVDSGQTIITCADTEYHALRQMGVLGEANVVEVDGGEMRAGG